MNTQGSYQTLQGFCQMRRTPTSAHTSAQRVQLEVWPHHTHGFHGNQSASTPGKNRSSFSVELPQTAPINGDIRLVLLFTPPIFTPRE